MSHKYDAVIIGSGPNGLVAALILAIAGLKIKIIEANDSLGGACSSYRDNYGVLHDNCAAVHPLALASPVYKKYLLSSAELKFDIPEISFAQVINSKKIVYAHRSYSKTLVDLGVEGKF